MFTEIQIMVHLPWTFALRLQSGVMCHCNVFLQLVVPVSPCLGCDEHKKNIHINFPIFWKHACISTTCSTCRVDKSNMAHAGRALQKRHALLDRQNKQWRGQEMEYLGCQYIIFYILIIYIVRKTRTSVSYF